MWLGGRAPAELRRVGRLGDGWLPSFCTPEMVAEGRVVVEKAAAEAGRAIDPEHFGAMVFYARTEIAERRTRSAIAQRRGVDPEAVVTVGLDALRERLEAFIAVGLLEARARPDPAGRVVGGGARHARRGGARPPVIHAG